MIEHGLVYSINQVPSGHRRSAGWLADGLGVLVSRRDNSRGVQAWRSLGESGSSTLVLNVQRLRLLWRVPQLTIATALALRE
jgi:hypothetical protein